MKCYTGFLSCYNLFFALLAGSIILLLLFGGQIDYGIVSSNKKWGSIDSKDIYHEWKGKSLPGGNPFVYDDKTAFVFGAQGVYVTTELFKCLGAIESLSKIGGWKGDIYFMMPDTTCLTRDVMERFESNNVHIITVKDTSPSFEFRPNRNNNEIKMQIKFEMDKIYAKNPKLELLVWYDCDVMFIKEGCVAHMIANKPVITDEQPIIIPREFHVGSFLINPQISLKYINQWRKALLNGVKGADWYTDFNAFKDAFEANHKYGISNEAWHDTFPNDPSNIANNISCAVHLSNGRCRHLGTRNIDDYVQSLGLESIGSRGWCPSKLRRWVKSYGYTWPFCWSPPAMVWDA